MWRLITPSDLALAFAAEREARMDLRDLLAYERGLVGPVDLEYVLATHTN